MKMKTSTFLTFLASTGLLVDACAPPAYADIVAAKRAALPGHKRSFGERRQVAGAAASGAAAPSSPAGAPSSAPSAVPSGAPPAAPPQSGAPAPGAPAPTAPPAAPQAPVPTDPLATIPLAQISANNLPEVTPTLRSTPTAGSTGPVSGAPPLPALTIAASAYPPQNTVPPVDSPQVQGWLKEIAGIDPSLLNMRPTVDGSCANDSAAAADTSRCWWTCGGCTNPNEDVVTCPQKMTWGLSFDDGPSPYTPKVMDYLEDHKLSGTFFIVGSRVLDRPAILQAEYMAGHHISVHTWSHSVPLTALSNAQIVAELGWARQAIKEVIGVTPLTMRPPWGDIDNRVRAISLAMGMKPIIWTRNPQTLAQFDTNDWKVVQGTVTAQQSLDSFQQILGNATQLNTGFIVLEHDLFQQEVDLSTGYTMNAAQAAGFKLMDINTCLGQTKAQAYLETVGNKSAIPTFAGAGGVTASTGAPGSGGATAQGNGALSVGAGAGIAMSALAGVAGALAIFL